jgi:hypothetical protein
MDVEEGAWQEFDYVAGQEAGNHRCTSTFL